MGSLRGRGREEGGRDGVRKEGGEKREAMEGWRDRGREEKEEGMMVQWKVKGNKSCYCEGELTWGRGCR